MLLFAVSGYKGWQDDEPEKTHTPERIIGKLQQAGVELAKGATVAQVLVERGRRYYHTMRPHSSLGYRPPAPETFQRWTLLYWRLLLKAPVRKQRR